MKFWMIAISLLITISSNCQVEFGFFAGPQVLSTNYKINAVKQKTDNKYGFQIGLGLKVPFEEKLFFAPAAFYSLKGYKVSFTQYAFPPDLNAKDNNTTIHTFELAGLLQYDFNSTPNHFFIKAGPSLDFQLFGHETYNLMGGGSVDHNMKFSFADYGHFSANILTQLGYESSSDFILFVQYTYGLASINNADFGPEIRHRVYGISFGKYFKSKK